MTNTKPNSLQAMAYDRIKNMILLREIAHGEKIFEKDLADKMHISRTPVREALLILERENLVENQDRLGFIVRRPKAQEIEDYFQIREALEQYAVPRIIANVTDQEIEEMKQNTLEAESYYRAGDTRNFILCNGRFHELLSETTHSALYYRLVSSLNDISILLRALSLRNGATMQSSLDGHKHIVAVLETRDADALSGSLKDHLEGIRNEMKHALVIQLSSIRQEARETTPGKGARNDGCI